MMLDQLSPPSTLIVAPPSLPLMSLFESLGSTHKSCVSPCGTRRRVKVRPPSIERQVERFMTYIVFASFGSALTTE